MDTFLRCLTRWTSRAAIRLVILLAIASGTLGAQRPTGKQPLGLGVVRTPDLIPVTDSGRFLTFQSRTEWRHAFWVRNVGTATSPGSRIRLKVYYRRGFYAGTEQPWTLHDDVTLDVVEPLKPGQESRALVSRILYGNSDAPSPNDLPEQFKWEFTVDDGDGNHESNEANNQMVHITTHAGGGKFETGPSGKFH